MSKPEDATQLHEQIAALDRRLGDAILDLRQRVAFLETLLDISIRVTDSTLRDHIRTIVAALDNGRSEMDPIAAVLLSDFIRRMRDLDKLPD